MESPVVITHSGLQTFTVLIAIWVFHSITIWCSCDRLGTCYACGTFNVVLLSYMYKYKLVRKFTLPQLRHKRHGSFEYAPCVDENLQNLQSTEPTAWLVSWDKAPHTHSTHNKDVSRYDWPPHEFLANAQSLILTVPAVLTTASMDLSTIDDVRKSFNILWRCKDFIPERSTYFFSESYASGVTL